MQTIGITGGTGLVGRHLLPKLQEAGYNIILFQRHPQAVGRKQGNSTLAYWNYKNGDISVDLLSRCEGFIHLAGESIAGKRWTPKRKQEILDSRKKGTEFICSMINSSAPLCRTFISASAVGYYGPDQTMAFDPFTEEDPAGSGFLANVCKQWEHATEILNQEIRKVIIRTAVVLSNKGGAFPQLLQSHRIKVNVVPGRGSQYFPWIHIEDHCRILQFALEDNSISGVYNSSSKEIVTLEDILGACYAYTKPWLSFHVPAGLMRLALGEMSSELLNSQKVSSKKLMESGFKHHFPSIKSAIDQLLTTKK